MDLGLSGRVAIVTGASRGLGRATAAALLAEGARVVAVARASAELSELESSDPECCMAIAGDLIDPTLPRSVVDAALARFGRLDVTVVNTPGPPPRLPLDASE